jgi:iron complex transport system permease protein
MWGLGSFANVSMGQLQYFSIAIIIGLILTFTISKPLNALLLGENYARNLGVNIKKVRMLIILITGLLIAVVTAYCGPIAFLGLAVPHISRNFFKTSDHLINIPGVILIGGFLALACNLLARLPGYEGALPINAITSIIGAPVVIWIIIKRTDFRADV